MILKSLYYKLLTLTPLLLFLGCSGVSNYTPYTVGILDAQGYAKDLKLCRQYGQEYLQGKSSVDPIQVASEGAQGALSGLGYLPISPFSPALSGLGKGSSEGLSELGVTTSDAKKVIALCMADHARTSGNYKIYDPILLSEVN